MFVIEYIFGTNDFTTQFKTDVYFEAVETYFKLIDVPDLYEVISINFDLPE